MKFFPAILLVFVYTSSASASLGFFGSYVAVSNNGSNAYYDLTAPGGGRASNPADFHGFNFGTFDPGLGNTLTITDAEGLTFKNGASDVTGVRFNYSVVATGGAHSYTERAVGFTSNATFSDAAGTSYSGGGDQQWSDSTAWAPVNLLTGLGVGTYEIQVFMRGTSNEGDFFHSNGGINYTATFSVVPEPTTIASFGLCLVAMGWRRRRPR